MDFYYLKRFPGFTVLYYEFHGFKSLEKTTTKNTAFTDAETEMTKRTNRRKFSGARLF